MLKKKTKSLENELMVAGFGGGNGGKERLGSLEQTYMHCQI